MKFSIPVLIVLLCGSSCTIPKPSGAIQFEERTSKNLTQKTIRVPSKTKRSESEPDRQTKVPVTRSKTGTVTRAELRFFVDQGPHFLLRQVPVEPVLEGRRFIGFRVIDFFAGDTRFRRVDLLPGDIITSVNQTPIERPEQFMVVWENLSEADYITVNYLRKSSP